MYSLFKKYTFKMSYLDQDSAGNHCARQSPYPVLPSNGAKFPRKSQTRRHPMYSSHHEKMRIQEGEQILYLHEESSCCRSSNHYSPIDRVDDPYRQHWKISLTWPGWPVLSNLIKTSFQCGAHCTEQASIIQVKRQVKSSSVPEG